MKAPASNLEELNAFIEQARSHRLLLSALEPERHPIEDKLASFSDTRVQQMMQAVLELLMDALRRRLVMVLLLLSALIIGGIGYGLQLEVVDGAIASAKVFGQIVSQSEEGSLNLTGIMTAVRTMWFILITLVCLILSAGTITDWMKDSYSIFLLQSGLSRAQVYLGYPHCHLVTLGCLYCPDHVLA